MAEKPADISIRANRDDTQRWRARAGGTTVRKSRFASRFLLSLVALCLLLSAGAAIFAWQIREQPLEHPIVKAVCGAACDASLAAPNGLAQIALHGMRVNEVDGRLAVTGFITNHAEYSQSQPALLISLIDASDRLITRRRIDPPNYLESVTRLPIASGQTRKIKYTIDDPGGAAIKYALALKAMDES